MTGKISGGAMTGTWVAAANGSSFINSTASAGTFHPMLSAKTTNGGMTLAFYQSGLQVGYLTKANMDAGNNTLAKNAMLMDESGNGTWPGTVSATSFTENGTTLSNKYAAKTHGTHLNLGTTSTTAYRGDYGNTAYNHSQSAHAPSNAQKNSDITKAEIEAKLTGAITSHTHNYAAASHGTHVSYGGNGSATTVSRSDHTHSHLEIKGTNTITSTTNDTTAKWGAQKTSIHWYTTTGQLIDQPGQWGYLLNIGADAEVHQLWLTQSSGDLKHRGGNASGWSGTWRTILDTSNFKTHVTPSAIGAAASSHGTHLSLGTTSSTAYRGDYGNTAYTHSQAAHAPSNAQKNSDITKAEIEAKLTGNITSHTHTAVNGYTIWTGSQSAYNSLSSKSNTTLYFIK